MIDFKNYPVLASLWNIKKEAKQSTKESTSAIQSPHGVPTWNGGIKHPVRGLYSLQGAKIQ